MAILQTVDALPNRYLDAFTASYKLSPREEDVMRLLQEGLTAACIADRLGISLHTVRDHLKHLYRKTATGSRSELLNLLASTTLAPPVECDRRRRSG
jgi:DNA-binding CsgD family transcriptional regulator